MDAAPTLAPTLLRRAAWVWPLVLALGFTGAFGTWLQWSDAQEAEDARHTLIADALTLDSRISDWLDGENAEVRRLAQALPAAVDEAGLLRESRLAAGLHRLWLSATALDAHNRILAHVPDQAPQPVVLPQHRSIDERGLSAHLAAPTAGGGKLVVQFDPGALLRQTVPWWLGRKYDVRLVDGLGEVIAATGNALAPAGRQSYRVSLEPEMADTYLELTTREASLPWWRRLPLALMAAFLLLSGAASWMLRRQMREVAAAETRWRTEAAWRRAIEDSLTVGLRGRDADGRLVHVNRAFCDLVGFTPEQLLGRMPPMPYWPGDAVAESMQRHRRNMAGHAPRDGYEARWVRSDGTPIDVMIFEAPLVDAQGRQTGWMGSIVDIGARKQAEERERRRAEVLATHSRLTTLGEVASALAHQLNQPLAAIAGYGGGVLRS
ncbi:MAG: PAS domain S-box protein, partial [Burkholderiales bacterium]|nr:PAS domain S-box protein [Burkholderiales bacterium]